MSKTTRSVVDEAAFDEICSFVQSNRSRVLSKEERLDILRLHAHLRHQHANNKTTGDVSKQIADMLGRGKRQVQSVWKDYIESKTIAVASTPANIRPKSTRVPHTTTVIASVQKFVRDKRQIRARVTAVDVLSHLINAGVMEVDRSNKQSSNSALRAVQRFLQHCGYKRGNKKGKKSLALTERNTMLRDIYVRQMCAATQQVNPQSRRTIVYTDESFIHS